MCKHCITKKKLARILGVFGVLFFALVSIHHVFGDQDMSFPDPSVMDFAGPAHILDLPVISLEPTGEPVRIRIPRIAVDATIEKVALATDGTMGVPKHPLNAGWYEPGPRPGEVGSAAIAGHVNWINGSSGVFARLHQIKPGDKITVQDHEGAVISFIVREIKSYDAAADATDVFTSSDGKAHLNLITCSGVWDKLTKQYSQRMVVFSDKGTE